METLDGDEYKRDFKISRVAGAAAAGVGNSRGESVAYSSVCALP